MKNKVQVVDGAVCVDSTPDGAKLPVLREEFRLAGDILESKVTQIGGKKKFQGHIVCPWQKVRGELGRRKLAPNEVMQAVSEVYAG